MVAKRILLLSVLLLCDTSQIWGQPPATFTPLADVPVVTSAVDSKAVLLTDSTQITIANMRLAMYEDEVYAHDFGAGWNGTDDTAVLQAAIDSGARTVVVTSQAGPWIVTPITLASNQHLIFMPGCEVQAKAGSFLGTTDRLFTAVQKSNLHIIGYGATWRMLRADYESVPYDASEFRHGLLLSGCTNVTVEGLQIEDCGGDAIEVGSFVIPNTNITLKFITGDNNYRNGLSIEHVDGMLVEDCTFSDSNGTDPENGVDVEPWLNTQHITNLVFRRVHTSGNARGGFFICLNLMDSTSTPVSITMDDCTSTDDGAGVIGNVRGNLAITTKNASPVAGSIEINRFISTNGSKQAVLLTNKSALGPTVVLNDCVLDNPVASYPTVSPLRFESSGATPNSLSGFVLNNLVINDSVDRNPIGYLDGGTPSGAFVKDVTGNIVLTYDGTTTDYPLTTEQLQTWIPKASSNVDADGTPAGALITASERGDSAVHKTVLTLTAASITVTDGTAGHPGRGGVQLYDFPAGAIRILGCTANLTMTAGVGGISDTFNGDFALGTVTKEADDTLDSTEVDILPKTATVIAVAGVGTAKGQSTATEDVVHDGTGTAKDMFLNVIIDDGDISADDTLAVSGTVTVVWSNLGDY